MSKKSVLPVLLLALIWGGYYVASQETVGGLSVFTAGVGIRLITGVFLTIMMAIKKELHLLVKVRGVLFPLVMIGVLGFLLDTTAFIGLSMGSAATGTALLKTDVLMVSLISVFVYKMHFSWKQWVCTIVMLLGVLMVIGINPAELELANWGNIFFLLSALFVSINAFVIKYAQHHAKNPVCDDVVAFYNNFVCMLLFLAASIVTNRMGEFARLGESGYLRTALLLAALGQTLVYIVYYYDLRRFPVWFVKVFLLLMPVVSTLICFVLFDEHLNAAQYGGMAVIILGAAGILLQQRTSSPSQHEYSLKKEESK